MTLSVLYSFSADPDIIRPQCAAYLTTHIPAARASLHDAVLSASHCTRSNSGATSGAAWLGALQSALG